MRYETYRKDLNRALKCRDDGVWAMTSKDLLADAALLLDGELDRTLAQRPMIGQEAGYYTTDVIMILGRAIEAGREAQT